MQTARNICLLLWISAVLAPAAGWPMFRGGPALLGVAAGSLPEKLNLLWNFKTAGPVKSSAAIEQGKIFIGSQDGNVYALAFADGSKLWTFKTGGPVESSPLVLEGKVFVGSSDGSLYSLEAATGKLLWKYETGDKILGGPNWVRQTSLLLKLASRSDDPRASLSPSEGERAGERGPSAPQLRILVGSYDYKLHCLDAAT